MDTNLLVRYAVRDDPAQAARGVAEAFATFDKGIMKAARRIAIQFPVVAV